MTRYRLSKDAERDLTDIAHYIAENASLEIAGRVLAEILESIIVIAAHPRIGRKEERYGKGMLSLRLLSDV